MTTAEILGRFLWHDLMTTDEGAASAFYPKVTGWKSEPWGEDSSYKLWVAPSGNLGGTMNLPPEAQSAGTPPHWLAYVGTPDIESTVETAQRLGGRLLKEVTPIPSVGKYAVLADPQGATFAVYSPDSADGAVPSGPGAFCWHELATSDVDAAFEFYSELFGWDKEGSHDMGGEMGSYVLFGQGGKQLGGIYQSPSDRPGGPNWLCYVSVSSAAKAAEAVKAAGGQVLNGPTEVPGGGLIVQLLDPQGAAFAVHEQKAAVKAARRPKKSAGSKASAAAAAAVETPEEKSEPAVAAAKRSKPSRPVPMKSGGAKSKSAKTGSKASASSKSKGGAAKAPAPAKSKAAAKSKGSAAAKKAAPKKAAVKSAKPAKKKAAVKKSAVKKSAAPKKAAASQKVAAKKKSPTKVVAKKKAAGRKR